MSRQIAHQSAENVRTTTLPRYSLSLNVLPCRSWPAASGAVLPTVSAAYHEAGFLGRVSIIGVCAPDREEVVEDGGFL